MTSLVVQPEGHGQLAALVDEGHFAEAWRVFRTGTDPWFGTAEAGLLGALAAARTGRYADASRTVTAALQGLSVESDPAMRLRGLLLSGGIALERGHVDEAEQSFQEAVDIARAGGDHVILARAWNNLGIVTHLRRHPLLAIKLFRDALRSIEPLGQAMDEARIRYNLALSHRELGELDRAEREIERAVALADATPDLALRALVLLGRAELRLAGGRFVVAHDDITEARRLARLAHDRHGEAEAQRVAALLAVAERRFGPARTLAREARRLGEQVGARLFVAECGLVEALALNGLWKPDEAAVELAEAVRQAKDLGAPRLAERFGAQWARRSRA